ncbi:MAG: hypothetical protein WD077_03855 [Bacteroidia bacterium]
MSKLKLFSLLIITPVLLMSCGGIGKMNKKYDTITYAAEPEALEVHADSVRYSVTGTIPPKYFHKRATMRIEPTLRYSDQDLPLDPIYLRGEKAEKQPGQPGKTISKSGGGSFKIEGSAPFDSSMNQAYLIIVPSIRITDGKYSDLDRCISPPEDTLLLGTITTSLSVKPTDSFFLGGSTKPMRRDKKAIFYYQINRSILRDTTTQKEQVKDLLTFISDTNNVVDGISITSYASPDGEVAFNSRLSEHRTNAAYRYMVRELRKRNIDRYNDTAFYRRASIKEDWEGFRRSVSNSNLENKNEVLQIIDSRDLSNEQKEERIRRAGTWDYLAENIFPPLRRSEVTMHTYGNIRDLDTVRAAGDRALNNLNQQEVLVYAFNHPDTSVKLNAYQYYMNTYPDDWFGPNNYAVALMWTEQYVRANEILTTLHNQHPDNDTIASNLGVSYRFVRNYQLAEEHLKNAESGGMNEDNNLGILYIKTAQYDKAVETFPADQCDYNAALAHTLAGQYDEAISRIECKVDKTAADFYLRAIAAARKGDKSLLTTSLTRAVMEDSSYREKATNDLEFRAYRDDPQFKNALR